MPADPTGMTVGLLEKSGLPYGSVLDLNIESSSAPQNPFKFEGGTVSERRFASGVTRRRACFAS